MLRKALKSLPPVELLVLIPSFVLGTFLRLYGLQQRELSADEGVTWACASAPSLSQVIFLQQGANPGKMPVHDILLHFWIRLFGDGATSLRLMSALFGIAAIPIVYLIGRELTLRSEVGRERQPTSLSPAAIATALFAVNLVSIKYAQEARMYSLMLLIVVLQVLFFLGILRVTSACRFVALSVATAVASAVNFTALLTITAEVSYILFFILGAYQNPVSIDNCQRRSLRSAVIALASVVVGLLIFFIVGRSWLVTGRNAINSGILSWVKKPAIWEPIAVFNKATGTIGFVPLAFAFALAIRKRANWRCGAFQFLLIWMWLPVISLFVLSRIAFPIFVERYILPCFVAFFLLAAWGIYSIKTEMLRIGVFVATLLLSVGHWYAYKLKPHDAQWREASHLALHLNGRLAPILVSPPYAVNVVRYYAPSNLRHLILSSESQIEDAQILILGEQGVTQSDRRRLVFAFPYIRAMLRGVEVRAKGNGAAR